MYLKWSKEMAHQEMIAAIVYQLTRNLTPEQIKKGGFEAYFVDHTTGIYPQSAAGDPFSAAALQSKGDAITDLFEDLAADGARSGTQLKISTRSPLGLHGCLAHVVQPECGR